MSIIVRNIEGAWQRQVGVQLLPRTVATCTVMYADGRQEEQACEPYEVTEQVDISKVVSLLADGVWGEPELSEYGLSVAEPFEAPEGKQATGTPSYIEDGNGVVHETYEVEDAPPPPPPPTPAEKLAAAGLTVDDLRALLAEPE